MKVFLLTIVLAFAACSIQADELREGRWDGEIDTGNGSVQLLLDSTGESTQLSIPEQGLLRIPVADLTLRSRKLRFTLNLGMSVIRFEGTVTGNEITGRYLQNGMPRDFSLRWTGPIPEETEADIMQNAGRDEKLTLSVGAVTLSGRLRKPFEDRGKWAALIIPGSGPTDGDGNSTLLSAPVNSLLRLANFLAAQGVPSLRIDKRGTGASAESTESEASMDFDTFVDDAVAWLATLKQHFPDRKIVVIGHSQGGLTGMIAANNLGCDAFISISASGYPIDITLERQIAAGGAELAATGGEILAELRRGKFIEEVPPYLTMLFRRSVQPFLISYMQYDPAKVIEQAEYPILIAQGEHDRQTGIADAEALLNSASSAEMVIIPLMNHLLRDVRDEMEDRATYGEDRLPLSKGLELAITDFLQL